MGKAPRGIAVYPDQLKAILVYIEALDAAEKKVSDLDLNIPPYMKAISLTDEGEADWGELWDEIGGSWCWYPPDGAA